MQTAFSPVTSQQIQTRATGTRVSAVDVLRGLIIVIMALDHVREYFGPTPFRAEDVTQTSVALFFTRWITHICAPLFLLLSGVSAYLYSRKHSRRQASVFLATRGLWLLVLELAVFSFLLQWNYSMLLLSILWAIGWSMLFLAAALWLPRVWIAAVAISIIVLHNLLPAFPPDQLVPALLHNAPFLFMLGKQPVLAAYTVFPWAAVMMLGYAIGPLLAADNDKSRFHWLIAGLLLLAAFVLLRATNAYGDPATWSHQARGAVYTALSFLNVSKYPPSLLFLLLTLGMGALLWALFRRRRSRFTAFLAVYGQVPFFFFLVHFALISASAYVWSRLAFGTAVNLSFTNPADWPALYQLSLFRVYAVWIALVLVLYYPCRWYGKYKQAHQKWWLSYL